MSYGPPTEDSAVSTFLDYLALACIFGFVEALIAGRWLVSFGVLIAAILFLIVRVKWPQIGLRAGARLDSALWNKWMPAAIRVLRLVVVLASITVLVTGYYEWRRIVDLFNPTPTSPAASRTTSAPSAPPTPRSAAQSLPPTAKSPAKTKAPPPPIVQVDWHDKKNWRRFLHAGMSRTEVRQLFGDPEHIAVVSTSEFWDFGYGRIDFDMNGHPDGSLYSWYEP